MMTAKESSHRTPLAAGREEDLLPKTEMNKMTTVEQLRKVDRKRVQKNQNQKKDWRIKRFSHESFNPKIFAEKVTTKRFTTESSS